MQKLLIVDDEPIIREGLKSIIPWADYGYQVCGEGVDGHDGLDKIRMHHPDLVLLDIRMPGLSGIEVIRKVKKEKKFPEFIILTAYSSFSYAKELMGLGIKHYLLKPINEEELIEILELIAKEREREREMQEQIHRLSEEKSFRSLLRKDIDHVADHVINQLSGKKLQVAKFSSHIKQINEQWLLNQVAQHEQQIKLFTMDNDLILLFIQQEISYVKSFLTQLIERFHLYGDDHITIMLGNQVSNLEEASTSFKQACDLDDVQFCYSDRSFFYYKDYSIRDNYSIGKLKKIDKQKLVFYLEFNDLKSVRQKIIKLQKHFQLTIYPQEKVKTEIIQWCLSIFNMIKKSYPSIKLPTNMSLMNAINELNNLQAIISYILELFDHISHEINKKYSSKGNIIDKVKRFIHHYYFENISLKSVADLFYYNNAYLGKLFKQQTGIFFNDYLHQVRIDNAKKLLRNKDYKVYEISEKVGYSNSDYFYKNFKAYEGISPKEYQMQHRKDHSIE